MIKVFIGGSRRITRLNPDVRGRLDRLMVKNLFVLIGDANGADRAVQHYLKSQNYQNVQIFCSNGVCRNNLGEWAIREVCVPKGAKGFDFYAAKDRQMAQEASVGLMIWDGISRGTGENVVRLLEMHKKVVIYSQPLKQFSTLAQLSEWQALSARIRGRQGAKSRIPAQETEIKTTTGARPSLF